jgi:hypothetical protein
VPVSTDGGGSKGAPLRREVEAFSPLHPPSGSVGGGPPSGVAGDTSCYLRPVA